MSLGPTHLQVDPGRLRRAPLRHGELLLGAPLRVAHQVLGREPEVVRRAGMQVLQDINALVTLKNFKIGKMLRLECMCDGNYLGVFLLKCH